jgi:hypothetical protein
VSQEHVAARLHLPDLQATRPLVALWGGLALVDMGRMVGASPRAQVVMIVALVAGCSYGDSWVVAVCVGGIGWLVVNGFVVHQLGQLGFVGTSDLVRAALFLGVALAATESHR